MAKWKPRLHKEVAAIFDDVPIPGESNSPKRNETLPSKCPYFRDLEPQGLHHRPHLVR